MTEGFTLERFAQHPFYQEVNRRLVALTGLRKGQCVVDLGAGTGAVTRLLAEQVASRPTAEVIAIEPSETAIEVARRNLENMTGAVVRFVQGGAEKLSQLVKVPVDAIFFCNAIHLIHEKDLVLQEIRKQISWNRTRPSVFFYRTAAGREVDFVLEDRQRQIVGIEVKAAATVGSGDFKGLVDLARSIGKRFHRGVVLYTGREAVSFGANLHAVPVGALWRPTRPSKRRG